MLQICTELSMKPFNMLFERYNLHICDFLHTQVYRSGGGGGKCHTFKNVTNLHR